MLKIKGDKEIYDGYQSNVMISWTTLQCLGVQFSCFALRDFEGTNLWPVSFQGLGDFLLYIVEQSMLMCTFDPWAAYPGWGEGSRPQQRNPRKNCVFSAMTLRRYQGENLCSSIIAHLYNTYIYTYIHINLYIYTCFVVSTSWHDCRTVVLEGKRRPICWDGKTDLWTERAKTSVQEGMTHDAV